MITNHTIVKQLKPTFCRNESQMADEFSILVKITDETLKTFQLCLNWSVFLDEIFCVVFGVQVAQAGADDVETTNSEMTSERNPYFNLKQIQD